MARYLYSELASKISAWKNCTSASANENQTQWADKHEEDIERLVKEFMPCGSGYDGGTKLDFERSHAGKLVFDTSFHHMDENGFYDGWTDHTVTVTPSFVGDLAIRISGRNRNDIKEMMYQDFEYSLHQDCTYEVQSRYFVFPAMKSRWIDSCRMVVDVEDLGEFESFNAAKQAIVAQHETKPYARKEGN